LTPTPGSARLTVEGPPTLSTKSETGDTGTLRVVVDGIAAVPNVNAAPGATEAQAHAALAAQHTSLAGTGEWTATIELLSPGQVRDPVLGTPVSSCGRIAWTLSSDITSYAAALRPPG
ncbi:MAG TPA: hypothetical protein VM681_10160, partial [Candidatus Thermoplasmatota archaeon]|nr:hypothetical protein [Candidatus Thermoplasmatota archaeon]